MSSKKGRKRPHGAPEENRAECPFTVTTKPTNVDSAKHDIVQPSKNSKNKESQGGRKMIGGLQTSPFKVQGKFETNQTMNVRYVVEPRDQWESLSRYNSFVLNGQKYQTEDFVFVANENTVELQKQGHQAILNPRASNFWVGQILEIRAADDHHVYARIYWMYSPDELWPNTRDRNMTISGRQPYHGAHELIASNHMEVINVLSVSAEAKVNHWVESNDDDTQEALYWRQGYDIRSSELSTVQLMCKCKTPGNPDKTLIGCTDTACGTWMHHECLKDAVLTRIYERLGNDKPHIPVVKKEPEDEPMPIINGVEMGQQQQHQHQQEPLSPRELKSEEREATMDVKSSEKPPTDIIIPPKSKKITPPTETPTPKETTPKDMDTVMEESIIAPMGKPPRKIAPVKKGRGRKPANRKPYEGLFEATLRLTEIPVTWDITDLRTGVEGVKTWTEYAECLVCGTTIE